MHQPDGPGCGQLLRPSSASHPLTPSGRPGRTPRIFHGCAMTPRTAAPAPRDARAGLSAVRGGKPASTAGRRCPWSRVLGRYSPEEQAGRSRRSPGPRRPRLLSAPGALTAKRASPAPALPAGPPCLLPAGTPHAVIGWRRRSLARACGCSYKNPRVPALSCSKSAAALPSAARAPPERSGRGHAREVGGREAGGPSPLPPAQDPGETEGGGG